ncbi:MAG: hypothetical protein ABH951_01890 [Patescibacteria group bacterium]
MEKIEKSDFKIKEETKDSEINLVSLDEDVRLHGGTEEFKKRMEKVIASPEKAKKIEMVASEILNELVRKKKEAKKEIRKNILLIIAIILSTILIEILFLIYQPYSSDDPKWFLAFNMIGVLITGLGVGIKKFVELTQKYTEMRKANYREKIEELEFKMVGIEPKVNKEEEKEK